MKGKKFVFISGLHRSGTSLLYKILKENDNIDDLGDELADVLFVLICLANQTGIDLENSFKNNLSNDQENPIKSFEHKKNTLFVYKNGLWDSMDSDDFKKRYGYTVSRREIDRPGGEKEWKPLKLYLQY